ncbi:MAG: hypothetical protein WC607_01355 [Candidatus Micrarchaeia archaeon]
MSFVETLTDDVDPLDSLFVKGESLNRELLRDLLFDFIRLDESGRIFPLTNFYSETNRNKVLLLLLASKALSLKTNIVDDVSPKELEKTSDIPAGSIRPTLRQLAEERLVEENDGRYKILSGALPRCSQILKSGNRTRRAVSFSGISTEKTQKSMASVLKDLVSEGELDSGQAASEVFSLVNQRRPNTKYNALYKVLKDLVHDRILAREMKGDVWNYRRI